MHEIEHIVNKELRHSIQFKIDRAFRQNLASALFAIIDKWEGVDSKRTTEGTMNHYRDYFKRAKKWWDQTKKKIFGKMFWINIFEHIIEVRL